ncbi:hypothetical protein A6A19_01735 [Actinobacillus delphinicola]|uniref:phosphohistidine phosphatase SixA n=1 Tax=Actinobacillus delphinicola TaxID=51161 RepID=UPI002442478C|nr:phosphohistidine phosphatase SixA [Actinobacillus delphinicola]MDG6896748.1 hypothetical protein [Actinobacillus delphinicola]
MNIFIMRHGQAEIFANSDEERALADIGKVQVTDQGKWLLINAIKFDKVLVSPYQRTLDTFTVIDSVYQGILSNKMEVDKNLTPLGDSTQVVDYLNVLKDEGLHNILIISHIPLVGELVTNLTQNSGYQSFEPATLVGINWNGKTGSLFTKHCCP